MNNWNTIEKNVNKEVGFLSTCLFLSPYSQNDAINCNDCLFRQIAILIVAGKIKVKKIIYKNNSIWDVKKYQKKINNEKQHGSHWHYSTIKIIKDYFTRNNYKVEMEPYLHYGKADLGVSDLKLFFEIGTINLYKLYYNLMNMRDCKIIIAPSDDYLIEFSL